RPAAGSQRDRKPRTSQRNCQIRFRIWSAWTIRAAVIIRYRPLSNTAAAKAAQASLEWQKPCARLRSDWGRGMTDGRTNNDDETRLSYSSSSGDLSAG